MSKQIIPNVYAVTTKRELSGSISLYASADEAIDAAKYIVDVDPDVEYAEVTEIDTVDAVLTTLSEYQDDPDWAEVNTERALHRSTRK